MGEEGGHGYTSSCVFPTAPIAATTQSREWETSGGLRFPCLAPPPLALDPSQHSSVDVLVILLSHFFSGPRLSRSLCPRPTCRGIIKSLPSSVLSPSLCPAPASRCPWCDFSEASSARESVSPSASRSWPPVVWLQFCLTSSQ